MKIICDANIFYSTSFDKLQTTSKAFNLIITKILVDEIFTNNTWLRNDFGKGIELLNKIKIIKDNTKLDYYLLQPEDILLTLSGVYSIPLRPTQIYTEENINSLIGKRDPKHCEAVELIRRHISRISYESLFPSAIAQLIQNIENIEEIKKEARSGKKYFELTKEFINSINTTVIQFFSIKVNKYISMVHNLNPLDYIPFGLSIPADNIALSIYSAFLYYRISDTSAKNDQFDLQYSFYMKPENYIWTKDHLLIKLFVEQLNIPENLYNKE